MLESRRIKTLYLGPVFMVNLNLPKDYRLIRDVLPPNICLLYTSESIKSLFISWASLRLDKRF